jgi:hypothetical protein
MHYGFEVHAVGRANKLDKLKQIWKGEKKSEQAVLVVILKD